MDHPRLAMRCLKASSAIGLLSALLLVSACATAAKPNPVQTGNQYAKDGLLREAVESYKKALSEQPANPVAHRNLGMVLVKTGDYKAAVKHLEKAMGHYESDFDANYYLGEAYRGLDKYSEAIFRYQRALKINESDPRALKPLAWSYYKIRYYSEALTTARELQKVAANDDQTAIIVARTLLKLKRSREALATIRSARKTIAKESRPFYASVEGDILLELGDVSGAETAYRDALKEQPLLAGALLGLGRISLNAGRSKQAITYMERAVRIRPKLTEAHYYLGKAFEGIDRNKSLKYYQYFRRQAVADPEFIARISEVKKRVAALQRDESNKGTSASLPGREVGGNGVKPPEAQ